ncbi:uncharacterized protein LOC126907803 [Daktulosphaira vitifoliae]|uniref:uncharacterized protein LOC126907803 n=1 Tax=Daktulosphaira vitifoliae TaxID=58002 RepID=UPI0021AA1150|nr:uncharacterized protein LOC126907803 [Daktulosphaira vitifoliae]
MLSLKLYTLSFALITVILYTTAKKSLLNKDVQLDKLLIYSGWKNLNEVKCITYYSKAHYLENLITTPTPYKKSDQKVRYLTIYLGCTYAKVMKNVILIVKKLIQICKEKIEKGNDFINGRICTDELVNIIYLFIVPLATLMVNAMDTLDSLHNNPMSLQKYSYMIRPRLKKIENIFDYLNEQTVSHNNILTYLRTLNTINDFFQKINLGLNYDTEYYCEFVNSNTDSLWKQWKIEYKAIIDQNIKLVFYKYLASKIKDYINTVIIENYFQLGFKFDPITEETFLPLENEPLELELEFKAVGDMHSIPIQIETHQMF